ncbi:GerMN domain-containing protein [Actinoplanes sp. CA-252034]|uniref:GerMN domain-containing protein n=1 Tax=Actinoplanes sp. CA-252034 TaxID=3239906 RepID=UPI003D97BD42
MTGVRGPAVTLSALLLLSACGVPAQDEPHPVVLPRQPLNATASAATAEPAGEVAQVLCLTRDERLVETVRRSGVPLRPQRQLDLLVTGPTPAEQAQGLSTALAATALTVTVPAGGATAAVEIGAPEEGAGRVVEALAYGQIVCTLTARTDIAAVTFLRNGQPLQVPDGDGAVTGGPLTAADYRSLIDPP